MARILVIDDDEAIRAFLGETLQEAGHEILDAANARGGVERARAEKPDLVLCDVNMPGRNGYWVLEQVRGDSDLATTPFLFLTGEGEQRQVRAGMASGADDYLTKPISPDDLLAAVQARLGRRLAETQAAERRLDEMRRSLAVLLPHELRTPLTAILGGARMIQSLHRELPDEELEALASGIVAAGQRLHRMAENYLLYAELELQRLAGGRAALRGVLGSAGADEVRKAASERAGEVGRAGDLRLELAELATPLAAPYLRKVVTELADNAFKFSEPGTPVTFFLRRSAAGTELAAADLGRGMTAQQVSDVAAFRQFDRALFEQQGSGLGLYLVKGIAEASGGQLAFTTKDAGTRVHVCWPA